MPVSGAMDVLTLKLANLFVGNDPGDECLLVDESLNNIARDSGLLKNCYRFISVLKNNKCFSPFKAPNIP